MTIRYVAEQLGVSMTLARRYLMLWETVPTHWHRQLVLLGIPPELLPRAENKKRGPSKIPVLNPHPAVCALFEDNPASRRNHANGKESLA